MSLRVLKAAAQVEQDSELHLARLLLLLEAAQGHKGVDGIMKLAKLDFLLRYPVCLSRALPRVGQPSSYAAVEAHEMNSIESRMVRFKYGPWDSRYRQWIGLLVARGLATTGRHGHTVHVTLTPLGEVTARQISARPEFIRMSARCVVVQKYFGRMRPTQIKDFVYQTFPELVEMKWGEDIHL